MTRASIGLTLAFLTMTAGSAAAVSSHWTKIETVPGFGGWREELRRLTIQESRARINHFCVVVEAFKDPVAIADTKPPATETVARVVWRERGLLLTWDQSRGRNGDFEVGINDRIDLRKDVVATEEDVGTSTYLVTRGWVRGIQSHCRLSGTMLTVLKP